MYTKQYLIDVYLDRFIRCSLVKVDEMLALEKQANEFYDRVGREKFRTYATVTADAIREYEANL